MITYKDKRVYNLRCEAEAIDGTDDLVTVELSRTAAWLLRDLLGLTPIGPVGLSEDMGRLNAVLDYRKVAPPGELPEPHVSGYTAKIVGELSSR